MRRSVRTQLFLLFAFFALMPLFVSNLWGYLQSRHYLTAAAFREVSNVAALESAISANFLLEKPNFMRSIIAGNDQLIETLHGLGAAPRRGANRADFVSRLRAHLVEKAAEGNDIEELAVFDGDGRLIASSLEPPSVRLLDGSCFAGSRERAGILGFDYSGVQPSVIAGAPIRDRADRFLGVLCGRFGFEVQREMILAHEQRTTGAELYMLDSRGRIVCGSFEDVHDAPFGKTHPAIEHLPLGVNISWQGRYKLPTGESAIAAYAPIGGQGLGILVEVPEARAMDALDRLRRQAIAFGAALAGLLTLAVFVTAQRTARPLRALADAARRTAAGALGETVPLHGPQEAAELARAFNQMSLALRASQDDLERRIADRTHELQKSEDFLELVLNSIDRRVVVMDRDLRIVKANRAAIRMHGDHIVGKTCQSVFEARSNPCPDCPVLRTIETGQPGAAERLQWIGDAQEIVRVEAFPVVAASGEVEAVIEIGRLVTAEKRMQAQAAHHEKMAAFGLLAAGIAHEIGNPLASIESQLRMTRESGDPARVQQTLGVVEREVQRISRLLRELVNFARRRRDEVVLVSINDVIEDVARLLGHDPRSRNVRIELALAETLPGVRAKEDQLVQVLLNLGINALDAMPNGGILKFSTSIDDGEVTARVCDQGDGIPDAARQRLFEPFFTTKAPGRGTGLGLFVSRGIVEALGGTLELERSGTDGTVFAVRLLFDNTRRKEAA